MRAYYRAPSGRSLRRPHYQNYANSVLVHRYGRSRYRAASTSRGGGIHIDHILAFVGAAIVVAVCALLVAAIFAAPGGAGEDPDRPAPIVHTRPQRPALPPPPPCFPFQGNC
ncbi:hypothetical protein [Nocardia callitridis]|uniref:Uncharacterized protein n=1 Tax=Nocardia callitridis TaxID=648753 RepID=A0ABP9KQW5_9NOCA